MAQVRDLQVRGTADNKGLGFKDYTSIPCRTGGQLHGACSDTPYQRPQGIAGAVAV